MVTTHVHIHTHDDWSPEAREAAAKARTSGVTHSKVPFVHGLVEKHGSHAAIKQHLQSVPRPQLNTAVGLLEKHGDKANRHDVGVHKMITNELNDRAQRGA